MAGLSTSLRYMRNGLQDVNSYSHNACQPRPRFDARRFTGINNYSNKLLLRPQADYTVENDAEWKGSKKPFWDDCPFCGDDDGTGTGNNGYGNNNGNKNGDTNGNQQGGGGDNGNKKIKLIDSDPYIMPYTSLFYPMGPHGPKVHLCPYVATYFAP